MTALGMTMLASPNLRFYFIANNSGARTKYVGRLVALARFGQARPDNAPLAKLNGQNPDKTGVRLGSFIRVGLIPYYVIHTDTYFLLGLLCLSYFKSNFDHKGISKDDTHISSVYVSFYV